MSLSLVLLVISLNGAMQSMVFCSLSLFLPHPTPSIGVLFRFYTVICVCALSLFRAASYSTVSGLHFISLCSVDATGWLLLLSPENKATP